MLPRNKLGGKARAQRTKGLIGVIPNKSFDVFRALTKVKIWLTLKSLKSLDMFFLLWIILNELEIWWHQVGIFGPHIRSQLRKSSDGVVRRSLAKGISSKRSNEVQGILDMIEYRNEIVIWLTEQRNYRGGWISTQVRTVPSRVVPSYGSPSHACEVVILIQFHHKVLVILVQNNGF